MYLSQTILVEVCLNHPIRDIIESACLVAILTVLFRRPAKRVARIMIFLRRTVRSRLKTKPMKSIGLPISSPVFFLKMKRQIRKLCFSRSRIFPSSWRITPTTLWRALLLFPISTRSST